MAAIWTPEYLAGLRTRFDEIVNGLPSRLEDVVAGRVVPALTNIPIGSARSMRAAVLFFDIRGFTGRSSNPDLQQLKTTLLMLDTVIPMVMQVITDHDGYVEKNIGDGVMGIIGAESNDSQAANAALAAAMTIFFVLANIANPFLAGLGIPPVSARIGIDLGPLLLARIGLPAGRSEQARSFLTAVGPAANLACKLQQNLASTDEIVVGDLVRNATTSQFVWEFTDITPAGGWPWTYVHDGSVYRAWRFSGRRAVPRPIGELMAALAAASPFSNR
jgi:adenylate cyclase